MDYFQLIFFAAFALILGSFLFGTLKYGSWTGAFLRGSVEQTYGEIILSGGVARSSQVLKVVELRDSGGQAYSTLKLKRMSQDDLTIELNGYVVLSGKIEAVWEAGTDGVPMYASYSLFPEADSAAKLPTLDDYHVTSIHILNGAEALRLAAGPDVAKAFEQKETLRVTAVGTFRLKQIGMGIACDQLHVGAVIESITGVAQLALQKRAATMSVC